MLIFFLFKTLPMNRRTILLLLLFMFAIAPVLIFSCKKEGEKGDGVYVTPPVPCDSSTAEFNEWFFFKTGSYWTYIDSAMGLYDSIYVFDYEEYPSPYPFWRYRTYSTFHSEVFSWNASPISGKRTCVSAPHCTCFYIRKIRFGTGNYTTGAFQFIYPMLIGERVDEYSPRIQNNFLELTEIIPSMTVNGVEYNNVVKFELLSDPTAHRWKSIQYVVRNVGIIRMEWPEIDRRWDLRSYQVFQN